MGFLSTLFFYLWTNFGWWLTFGMYEMTVGGLMQCYIAALPFLKNQIFSVLIFVPSFAILLSFAFSKIKVPQKDIKIKLAKEEMRS